MDSEDLASTLVNDVNFPDELLSDDEDDDTSLERCEIVDLYTAVKPGNPPSSTAFLA
jgi:hypothetical protein